MSRLAACCKCLLARDCEMIQGRNYCSRCRELMTDWLPSPLPVVPVDPRHNFVGSPRCFGVELETHRANNLGRLFGRICFGSKPDGSAGVFRELYSPILSGNDGFNAIDELCIFALRNKWQVSKGCGYHIHIDMRDCHEGMIGEQLVKVILGYYLTEEYWFLLVPHSRRSNVFCESMREKFNLDMLIKAYYKHILPGRFKSTNRYTWVSPCAWWKHKTVEIRLHNATIHPVKVKNWLRVHLRFVDWLMSKSVEQITQHFIQAWLTSDFYDIHCKLVDIWKDPELGLYYQDRATKFGSNKLRDWNPSFVEV